MTGPTQRGDATQPPSQWMEGAFGCRSWHDNHLYGVRLGIGDVDAGDWRSELLLDIDHVLEWICGPQGGVRFRVSPASLVFHDVTDLQVQLVWPDTGCRSALSLPSIDRIGRERLPDRRLGADPPYYRWRIEMNHPTGGVIAFGASGFTQRLWGEPMVLPQQTYPADLRRIQAAAGRR